MRLISEPNHSLTRLRKTLGFAKNKVERLNRLCSKNRATHDTIRYYSISVENIRDVAAVSERVDISDYAKRSKARLAVKLQSLVSAARTQTILIDGLKQTLESEVFFDEIVNCEKLRA